VLVGLALRARRGSQGTANPALPAQAFRVLISSSSLSAILAFTSLSTINHSGGLFSVAPVLRPPARQHKPRNGPRPPLVRNRHHCGVTCNRKNSLFQLSTSQYCG
jgi:hypothetical protein